MNRMLGVHVELIGDFTHDLFQNVLKRNQPLQRTIFIHYQREMGVHAQELTHLVVQCRCLRYEVRRHCHVRNSKPIERCWIRVRPGNKLVHRAQQVLGMDHTNDVFLFAAKHGQTGMGAVQTLFQDFIRGIVGINHLDPGAM